MGRFKVHEGPVQTSGNPCRLSTVIKNPPALIMTMALASASHIVAAFANGGHDVFANDPVVIGDNEGNNGAVESGVEGGAD